MSCPGGIGPVHGGPDTFHPMRWLIAILLVNATACLTLAAIHAHVWLRQRETVARLAFAVLGASVAAMAFAEIGMALATTPQDYGRMLWWYQWPVWSGLVATVVFVRRYLQAGRAWLGWLAIGLRTFALVINAFSSPSIHLHAIDRLETVAVLGDPVALAVGTPGRWLVVAHLALLALILFIADAAWDLWRRGEQRRALTIGGSLVLFVGTGTLSVVLAFWAGARLPLVASLFFAPIVVAMAAELGRDLIRAVRLAAELDEKSQELEVSEDRLALAADAARAGLWSVDLATRRLWATPRALSMFDLDPERSHDADDILAAIHPDDRDRVRGFADATAGNDEPASVEYRVQHALGLRWYATVGRVRGHTASGAGQVMGVTIDVTDRRRAEDEAAQQRARLEHLSRVATVSELSGALAHELAQPLAIIMTNAEAALRFLHRAPPDLAEVEAILGDIVSANQRAGDVIARLRRLLQRGEPNAEPLRLNRVVEELVRLVRADLVRRGVTVDVRLDPGDPVVHGDRIPLEQVLMNLVGNACDAMAGNAADDRLLVVTTRVEGGVASVSVRDNGTGLPASAEAVFAPFYTTKPQGLGLGLALSRTIVAAHGGRLVAVHNDDRGATLHVELPLHPATPATSPKAVPVS